jgi:hypothetical protein
MHRNPTEFIVLRPACLHRAHVWAYGYLCDIAEGRMMQSDRKDSLRFWNPSLPALACDIVLIVAGISFLEGILFC